MPPRLFAGACAILLAALTVAMTLAVFSGNPRNVDGFAQLFQARIFLAGRTWAPPPAELANFATLQMILGPARWFSQYPPGQSAVLAAGLAAGAWWLLNPLLAALLALATWRVARWCAGDAAARLALILLCCSPFIVAVAGSEMSHLGAATLGMGAAAMAIAVAESGGRLRAVAAGLLLGLMTSFRPLDAVAAAVPVALMVAFWCETPVPALLMVALGGIAGSLPALWFNASTTGSWHLFGYTALWGPQHSLGFHPVPFGVPLTLTRAIARSGLDLHQLNRDLLDATFPLLPVVAIGFSAGRRGVGERDLLPFAGAAALVGLLFFYWHRDVFYGPRFLYSAAPWFVIAFARALVLLRRAGGAGDRPGAPGLLAAAFAACALLTGLVTLLPSRLRAYERSTPVFALHPDRDAARAGLRHAVALVPDGWGTRLVVRMWALGVPVSRSTRLYAAIDACTLEQALARAETGEASRAALPATLDSLAARGRPGERAGATPDANLRLPPGPLPPECAAEVLVDRRGFYQFAAWLWLDTPALDGDVVWARDLGPGNTALFRRYAGRRFYRYAPDASGAPGFIPVTGPGW